MVEALFIRVRTKLNKTLVESVVLQAESSMYSIQGLLEVAKNVR